MKIENSNKNINNIDIKNFVHLRLIGPSPKGIPAGVAKPSCLLARLTR